MGQQTSNQQYRENEYRAAQKKKSSKQVWKVKTNYDGLLKLERTPFENCQKIQIDDQIFFLEKTRMDLKDLIKNKIRLRKQFSEDQVIRLIENIVYTLAYLQNVNIPYPDLSTNTILISHGTFKLLPPQIIRTDTFQRLKTIIKQKSQDYVPASPEMVIAMRCHQQEINQKQFLYKSNVFALGIILLQVCTLKPSSQCYNLQNYDILDAVITERIEDIESFYSRKIARIIANMLDYQFDQRMTPKELSVWVNRQLHETEVQEKKPVKYFQKPEQPLIHEQKPMIKSRLISQPGQIVYEGGVKTKRLKIGENRIDVIRNKIMKEKLKNQLQITENIESGKTRLRSSIGRMTDRENRSKKKNLPNPYLMHQQYNKGNQKSPYKYEANHQKRDLGIHDLKKLRNDSISISNTRFAYKNNYQERGSNSRQKNIDIKYKYNINEDPDNTPLSATKRKDGERFVRVQKHLIQYKKSLSGKKYDYDIGERYLKQDNKIGDKYQKQMSRSPSRKNDLKQNANISDFSFQPIKPTNGQNKKQANNDQPEEKPLSRKENNCEWTASKSDLKDKKKKENRDQITYERHQQLFQNESKGGKRTKIENQDMQMIKKQIQRSRKIIEEVRRSQQENNIFDQ